MSATHEHEIHHPIAARLFTRIAGVAEDAGQDAHRRRLLDGLRGRVLELGCGHGLNFRHYPDGVEEVVAVEPEPYLRGLAEEAARDADVPVTVRAGVAEALPFPDASFDAAVCSLVLCEVPDQLVALRELRRVLRDRGELRFYEHVRADGARRLSRVQRFADATFWPRISGGCHAARPTAERIEQAGFEIVEQERFDFRPSPLTALTAPRVLGVARPRA